MVLVVPSLILRLLECAAESEGSTEESRMERTSATGFPMVLLELAAPLAGNSVTASSPVLLVPSDATMGVQTRWSNEDDRELFSLVPAAISCCCCCC